MMLVRMRVAQAVWLPGALMFLLISGGHAQTATAPTRPAASQPGDSAGAAPRMGNPEHGKVLYQGCGACHSIDENDIGPKHRGVVGRKAGTAPGYAYSSALKASGIVWDKVTLDRWLSNPSAMVPGTKMFFLLANPQDRADVIAYLAELK